MRDEVKVNEYDSTFDPGEFVLRFFENEYMSATYSLKELKEIYKEQKSEALVIGIGSEWIKVDESELEKLFKLSKEDMKEYFGNKNNPSEKEVKFNFPSKSEIEKELGNFLPTVEEFEVLEGYELKDWMNKAVWEIEDRNRKRNPFPLIKERISDVLKRNDIGEEEKETLIFIIIEKFNKEYRNFI